jgi:VanZ family protein
LNKFVIFLSLCFFAFILWIIFLANTGQDSIFFELVAAIPYGDKLGHFCLFGVLTFGANFAFRLKTLNAYGVRLYIGAIVVFTFALLEELSQFFMAERTLDVLDLSADLVGIVAFSLFTSFIVKRFKLSQ